jgi:hypothetical protein
MKALYILSILFCTFGCTAASQQRQLVRMKADHQTNELNDICRHNKSYFPIVAAEITSMHFKRRFVDNVCEGNNDSTCESKFGKMFFARLVEKYGDIDWNVVGNHLNAYPELMNSFGNVELYVIELHNNSVSAQCEERAFQIKFEEDQSLLKINKFH